MVFILSKHHRWEINLEESVFTVKEQNFQMQGMWNYGKCFEIHERGVINRKSLFPHS